MNVTTVNTKVNWTYNNRYRLKLCKIHFLRTISGGSLVTAETGPSRPGGSDS